VRRDGGARHAHLARASRERERFGGQRGGDPGHLRQRARVRNRPKFIDEQEAPVATRPGIDPEVRDRQPRSDFTG